VGERIDKGSAISPDTLPRGRAFSPIIPYFSRSLDHSQAFDDRTILPPMSRRIHSTDAVNGSLIYSVMLVGVARVMWGGSGER